MLTNSEIQKQIEAGLIKFDPPPARINPNSVNLRLGPTIKMYAKHYVAHKILDNCSEYVSPIRRPLDAVETEETLELEVPMCEPLDFAKAEETVEWEIPREGIVLWPNLLYLGSTLEYITSGPFILQESTRSGVARLGLSTNRTAGFGDVGFSGCMTLEITVVQPIRVYAKMEICQVAFFRPDGELTNYTGRYSGSRSPKESQTWREFVDRPKHH